MSKSQVTRIGTYAVISKDSLILLCRLCGELKNAGRWTLPGGGLDFGESLEEGLMREVFEETGFHVLVGQMVSHHSGLWQLPERDIHSFQFLFDAKIESGELTHETNGSTDLVEWVELGSITDMNSVDIVQRAKEMLKQRSLTL